MSHPTEGELRAFLDGEASDSEAARIEGHLQVCEACESLRRDLVENEAVVRQALERLAGNPDSAAARRAVERRLSRVGEAPDTLREDGSAVRSGRVDAGETPIGPAPGRLRWPDLLRAAAVAALLLAGVSAALPGSPVNAWILRTLSRAGAAGTDPGASVDGELSGPSATDAPGEGADGVAVRVGPNNGVVRVELGRVDPGTRVRIVLVDGERAGISAERADGFRSGSGFLGVIAPAGVVTIELPRSVPGAEIRSGDSVLLRKEGSSLEFPTIMPESDQGAFVLTITDTTAAGDG